MRTVTWVVRGAVVGALLVSSTAAQSPESAKEQAALATALRAKHVVLGTALEAAATKGKPISVKYEMGDGKLQLSVYTEKGGQFFEVIVDHHTGKVAKTEKITDAGDLKNATAQMDVGRKAKKSLRSAVEKAIADNPGYTAVSATAVLSGGQPA